MGAIRAIRAAGLAALATALLATPARAGYKFTAFDGAGDHAGGTTINGIGNDGGIVGFSMNADNSVLTNFVRNPGGSFTTLNIGGNPTAMANGVNAAGQVVGANGNDAFFLDNKGNTITMLPPANPGNTASEVAFGINDKGTIVGQYADSGTGTTPGFVFSQGAFTILNPVAGAAVTNAQGVNGDGLVTGFYSTDGMHQHGFFYDTKTAAYTLPADPVVPNLFLTQFLGVNDHGQAVGYWQDNAGSQHGFLYDLATRAYTFMDEPDAATINGLTITQITGINDSGEIAGFFVGADGLQHGFFATAVPEPGSLALLGLGLAAAFGLGARRRGRARRDLG